MESNQQKAMSIVMLPYLAHGHVSPFYELAKRLSDKGFQVYFCSTPICLEPIRNSKLISSSNDIVFIDLQLPSSFHEELPPHYHSTKNLPPHLKNTLLAAFDASKPAFSDILKSLRPDLVIYDLFQPWAAEAAREENIEAVLFLTSAAAKNILNSEMTPKETEMDEKFKEYLLKNRVSGMTYTERFHQSVTCSYQIILVKTSTEIESKCSHDHSNRHKLVPVGLLVQKPQDHDGDEKIMDWLSKKKASSVVFVSFGSENFLSEEEMEEMAHGLELSNVDFIWVVRFHGGNNVASIQEALPQGFLERTEGRGLIVDWAPQAKILAHTSTGGFVSHCGWSSTVEAMMHGIPIIANPMGFDQTGNAMLAVDMGVGIEVPRRERKFTREVVANVIRTVVVEEEGKQMRMKAKELSERLKKKEDEEFDEAMEMILQIIEESRNSAVASNKI